MRYLSGSLDTFNCVSNTFTSLLALKDSDIPVTNMLFLVSCGINPLAYNPSVTLYRIGAILLERLAV